MMQMQMQSVSIYVILFIISLCLTSYYRSSSSPSFPFFLPFLDPLSFFPLSPLYIYADTDTDVKRYQHKYRVWTFTLASSSSPLSHLLLSLSLIFLLFPLPLFPLFLNPSSFFLLSPLCNCVFLPPLTLSHFSSSLFISSSSSASSHCKKP